MMLAARGAFLAARRKKGWTNPYVTDGLVAMWDGEWNAGPGKHDPNATTWVDLSGNGYDVLLNNTRCSIEDMWIKNTTTYTGNAGRVNINLSTFNIVTGETVASYEKRNKLNNYFMTITGCGTVGNQATSRLIIRAPYQSNPYQSNGTWMNYYFGRNNTLNNDNQVVSVSVRDNLISKNPQVFLNNVEIFQFLDGWHMSFTLDKSAVPYSFLDVQVAGQAVCRLYSFRLYSRALTAAEIAANYAVDKARFNLP